MMKSRAVSDHLDEIFNFPGDVSGFNRFGIFTDKRGTPNRGALRAIP
jgi:hypothetical protein